ncbi:hypothetical protein [Clostridium felsineum]|uniref:hypothetical protein n=1 Tax=Clostridium felsineum TaxID=36839 RepID=UPI0011156BE7|nr:hypothetical protein [Clostridium felsineum]
MNIQREPPKKTPAMYDTVNNSYLFFIIHPISSIFVLNLDELLSPSSFCSAEISFFLALFIMI